MMKPFAYYCESIAAASLIHNGFGFSKQEVFGRENFAAE